MCWLSITSATQVHFKVAFLSDLVAVSNSSTKAKILARWKSLTPLILPDSRIEQTE
jgi:hypothetical protein